MDRIANYYNRKSETQRLFSGRGELEFLRTKQIIEQFLPDETGLSIADVGGGSGPYAFWLAEKGHKETGVHCPNKDNTKYFTDAYLHHPDEIEREAEEAHLHIMDHVAIEGVGRLWQNFDQIWSDPRQRTIMLEMIDRTDRDRSILGASGHMNYGQCLIMPQNWYRPTIQGVGLSILAMQDNLGAWLSSQIRTTKS